jgi:hypothetical protein
MPGVSKELVKGNTKILFALVVLIRVVPSVLK